jgi:CHAD domain-containing protein
MRRNDNVPGQPPRVTLANDKLAQASGRYFDARLASLRKNLRAAQRHYDIEGIHELRVDTKRLRALFHLVKALDADFTAGYARTGLKGVYKAAGVLRDIHVQQARLRKARQYLQLSEYYNALTAAELSARPGFGKAAQTFSVSALQKAKSRMSRPLAKKPAIDAVAPGIEQSLSELNALARKRHPSVSTLHEIRKSAKELHYLLEVWRDAHGSPAAVDRAIRTLKEIHQALGRWRDTKLLRRSLRSFLTPERARQVRNRAAYRKYLKELDGEATGYLRKYSHSVKSLPESMARAGEVGRTVLPLE